MLRFQDLGSFGKALCWPDLPTLALEQVGSVSEVDLTRRGHRESRADDPARGAPGKLAKNKR
jgi:hypothetical protein